MKAGNAGCVAGFFAKWKQEAAFKALQKSICICAKIAYFMKKRFCFSCAHIFFSAFYAQH